MLKGAKISFNVDAVNQTGTSLNVSVDKNGDGSTDQQTTLTDNIDTKVTDSLTSDEGSADQGHTNP
jgi:hypothetical protein